MSRIGLKPIAVPAGVEVKIDGNTVTVKGPKGELTKSFSELITIAQEGNDIKLSRPNDESQTKALHGLTRALVNNMVIGVTEGFSKTLEINGVGYRAAKEGKTLVLTLGYSHLVKVDETDSIKIDVPDPNKIVISGIDKQEVGQFACEVRAKRPPEPYKGKGIKYIDEVIIRKDGKAGKGTKG